MGTVVGLAPERLKGKGSSRFSYQYDSECPCAFHSFPYTAKWGALPKWCGSIGVTPSLCEVGDVLSLAFSTMKVYAAAVSTGHIGYGVAVFSLPLVKRLLRGCCVGYLRPPLCPCVF